MDFETALTIVNTVMAAQGHTLSEAELALLKGAWHGQTYEVITEESSYTSSYLTRVIGPRFWKHLSEALGQQVSKTSFRAAIAQAQSANTQLITAQSTSAPPPTPPDLPRPQLDWGEAPDVATFYGRQQELDTLRRWALGETASGRHKPCRLGSILGMGGMGKTALSARFVEMLLDQPDCPFTHIIWRSLRNAPTLKELLAELIPFVSSQQETEATARRLMHWLRQSRCLLILDNLETILQGGSHAGYFRPDYEDYGELLRQVAETRHQSTVLLTSREKPAIVGTLEGVDPSVQSLQLSGSPEAAQALLAGRGLTGTAAQQRQLGERYNYSPLALKIVATSIQSVFDGDIGLFLAEDTLVFNGLQRLLEQQFARLTALEQQVMGWLAVNREWTSIPSLIEDIKPSVSRSQLLTALESLHWRSLIETASLAQGIGYTQQPVVMEYVTSRLIRQIVEELSTGELDALLRYPLLKTTVKDYVRLSQRRLILQPVATQLKKTLDTQATLKRRLGEVLTQLRQQPTFTGYAIGNLLNLCLHLKLAIADLDFSEAVIHHAYLQGETLQGVSFAGATFVDAAFTQTFGNILAIAFAPDGQRLAASDTSGQVWVWQSSNLNHPYLRFQAHGDWVWSLAFSPDGQVLVSGSDDIDDTLKVWSAETGDHLRTLKAPNHQVRAVGWSADQTRLASSGVDGTVRIWDEAGNCLAVLTGHSNKTSALAWQPVAEGPGLLATGSSDETIKIWDVASGECLRDISVGDSVFAIAWSPDGQTLASGSKAGGIQLWRSQTGECLKRLEGHQNSIWSLDWSVSGALASGGDDCSIRLWNPETGQCLRVLQGHQNAVRSLHWQPTSTDHPNQAIDGARADLLASGSFDQTVRLWSSRADASLKVLQGYRNSILAVAWHPDGRLASGGQDGLVRVWDPKTGDCLMALAGHNRPVWAIACSRGGILASGGDDQTIRLWDLQTQRPVATLKGHQDTIWGLAWHPSAAVVASA
ncbi:MAG: NACHT domain-containing protein, partial [Cyanobacteria bacterium P01_A01_bin.135]